MSNIDKYTNFIAEQVRKGSVVGLRSAAINEAEDSSHTYGVDHEKSGLLSDHDKIYDHVDKVLAHAKKKGYKINHNDGKSKKAHAKPDITFHRAGPNDNEPSAYTVHKGGAAHSDSKVNPGAKHHAYMYSGSKQPT